MSVFNRTIKITAVFVVICMISLLFVSCDKGDGDTSGNAQSGFISKDDKSEGSVISGLISQGGEVVSKVEDTISGIISDIMPDNSDKADSSEVSETPSTTSFVSEGEISNI